MPDEKHEQIKDLELILTCCLKSQYEVQRDASLGHC